MRKVLALTAPPLAEREVQDDRCEPEGNAACGKALSGPKIATVERAGGAGILK